MTRATIFTRTDKGEQTAASASRELANDLRKVLDAIDGTSSVDALQSKLNFRDAAWLERALAALVAKDLIREAEGSEGALDFTAFVTADDSRRKAEEQARREAEEKAKREAEEKMRREADEKARREAEAVVRREAEAKAKREAEEKARREAEAVVRREAEAKAKREAEEKARREAEAVVRREAEAKAKREAEEKIRREAEAQVRREAEERTRKLAEEKELKEAAERVRRKAAEVAREEAEKQAKLAEERELKQAAERVRSKAAEHARLEAVAQAQKAAEEEGRRVAEELERRKAAEAARQEAEEQSRKLAEEQERRKAAERAREEAEQQARKLAEDLARRDAEEQTRREAEAQARRDAEENVRREAEERVRREAEEKARHEADEKARQEAAEAIRREAEERARHETEDAARREAAERPPQDAVEVQEHLAAEEKAWREAEDKFRREEQEAAAKRGRRAAAKEATAASAKPSKRARQLALALTGLLVIGLAGIHLISFDGQIPQFEKALAAQFQQPVKIKALHLSLVPQRHVRLEGVSIGSEGQINIRQIKATGALGNVFNEKKAFSSVELDSPVVTEEGLGWLLFGKPSAEGVVFGPVSVLNATLQSKNVSLPAVDAKLQTDDKGAWQTIAIESVDKNLGLKLTPGGESVQIEFNARSFKIPFGSSLTLEDLVASGTANRAELAVKEFKGFAHGGILSGNARLKWGAQWTLAGELNARQIDVAQLLPGLVDGARLVGKSSFAMQAPDAGSLFAANRMEGNFVASRGTLLGVDLGRLIQAGRMSGDSRFAGVTGVFVHERDATQIGQLRLSDGALSATGTAEVDANANVRGRFVVDLKMASEHRRANLALSGTLKKPEWRRP